MNQSPIEKSSPWYVHFWPWFVIALLLAVVIASFVTLALALRYPDEIVSQVWAIIEYV